MTRRSGRRKRGRTPKRCRSSRGPQDYITVDAALPSGVNFGPAERAQMVKQSLDICQKKGVLGSGYIPKVYQTTCTANSEGLFAYYQYAEAGFILTCRTKDGGGSGWAGLTGHQRHLHDRRDPADGGRRRQGAQEPEAARDRAWTLHDDSRAARQRPLPVADDRPVQRAHRRRRPSATTSAGTQRGHDEGRREAVQRQLHAQERHRQPGPAADADWRRRHGGQAGDVDREGRAEESFLRSHVGEAAEEGADACRARTRAWSWKVPTSRSSR